MSAQHAKRPDLLLGMTIGQLADRADVNVETIRYYHRRGILKQPLKPARGYRRYSDHALRGVRFVKRAQQLGFSLEEIAEMLTLRQSSDPRVCEIMNAQTRQKLDDIDAKIRDLSAMRATLSELLSCCPGTGGADDCPILGAMEPSQA